MYTLHYWPDSASIILRLVLRELDAPFDERLIDRKNGALDSPAYRRLHPLGQIPALETPDGPMFETAAMLLYLADRHPGLAPAPDHKDRAAFLKWLFFTSTNVHTTLMQLFYPHRTAGQENSAAVLAHAEKRMADLLAHLETAATANPDWLSNQKPTVLGYYIAVLMRWLSGFEPDMPFHFYSRDYPALHRVLSYLETRPAARAVAKAEAHGPLLFTNPT